MLFTQTQVNVLIALKAEKPMALMSFNGNITEVKINYGISQIQKM
jgi:hypothetical protein